jgi:hypothetical protein
MDLTKSNMLYLFEKTQDNNDIFKVTNNSNPYDEHLKTFILSVMLFVFLMAMC